MEIFETIKKIPIEGILSLTWIKFTRSWDVLCLWEHWEETNWWKASLSENIVNDFNPNKHRASWNPYDFVKKLHWFNDKQTLEWFSKHYKLDINSIQTMEESRTENYKEIINRITKKWESLQPLSVEHISYLASRAIDYDKIKDFSRNNNWWISSPITNTEWDYITLQSRNPDPTAQQRFRIEKNTLSKWVFMHWINKTDKRIIVVEWLFDWYTLRQYYTNTVWLKSSNDGIEIIEKMFNAWYEIYIIPDNDEAWKMVLEKFANIDYKLFDISLLASKEDWVKDINDFVKLSWYWEWTIEVIFTDSVFIQSKIKKDYEIRSYQSLLDEWLDELLNTDPTKAISWWYKELDNKLWYILWWELVVVWWLTWSWKSTFVNNISNNVSRQWFKVGRFTLEDRQQSKRKEELYYAVWKARKRKWLTNYPKYKFMINDIDNQAQLKIELTEAKWNLLSDNKNIYDVVNNTTWVMHISKMEALIQDFVNKWVNVIIIDHLHYFKFDVDKKDRKDEMLEQIMQQINSFCRVYNIFIMLVAHYKKIWWARPDDESFKDAVAIAQVPNKIIHVHRDKMKEDALTELIITKNREWFTWVLELNYDTDTWVYTNIKSDMQIKREWNNLTYA